MRWPGKIPAGAISNEIVSHLDWLPTLLAAAGEPNIKEKLKKGHKAGDETYKVYLDGYNLLPYLTGKESKSSSIEFFYFSDDGDLVALRYDNWKMVFMEQRVIGTLQIWAEPFVVCAYQKFLTCAQIPMKGQIRPLTPITTGCLITLSCWCLPRVSWQTYWQRLRNFLRARKRQALPSTR